MAETAATLRDALHDTLAHVQSAFDKIEKNAGRGKTFTFPDLHKTSEGLFLSGWTYWEQFLRRLLTLELAQSGAGTLRRAVKEFKKQSAAFDLAEAMVGHPDEDRWVEWSSIAVVLERAESFLGSTNRFVCLTQAQKDAINRLKRVRNAVAHKSDKAWTDFKLTVQKPPYSLAPNSMQGLTVGRFLAAHRANGVLVFRDCIGTLKSACDTLVP